MHKDITYNFQDLRTLAESESNTKDLTMTENFDGFNSIQSMLESFKQDLNLNGQNSFLSQTSHNVFNDVAGFAPNVPAYLNNEPLSMFNFETTAVNKLIELNIYVCYSYKITFNQIKKQADILANFLKQNSTGETRFKVCFKSNFKGIVLQNFYKGQKKPSLKCTSLNTTVTVCEYNDYITNEILNVISSAAMFRFYLLSSIAINNDLPSINVNGYPVMFSGLSQSDQATFIDFNNMETELRNKVKIF